MFNTQAQAELMQSQPRFRHSGESRKPAFFPAFSATLKLDSGFRRGDELE
jgi:hypothetical protein